MSILKELEIFFEKTIPNVVTKEIPKFVTETVPSVFERDTYAPDLPPLRKEVKKLAKRVEDARDDFFASQGKLKTAQERYQKLAEDYNRSKADQALALKIDTKGAEKMAQELKGTAKTLKDIYQASRLWLGVATLGLTEIGHFMHAENSQEREQLHRSKASLVALLKRYKKAIQEVARAHALVDAGTATVADALRQLGISETEDAASKLTESQEALDAKRQLAAKLMADEISNEGIALITGLSASEIEELAPDTSDPLPDSLNAEVLSKDDIAMIEKVKGDIHVV